MKTILFFMVGVSISVSNLVYSQPLQNGGFENGYAGWNYYSQASDGIVGTADFFASSSIDPPVVPLNGSYMARLGGYSYNVNYLSQIVTLPVASLVKLEMNYQSRSSNTSECAGLWVGAKVNLYISGTSIYEAYLCYYNDLWQWTYGYFDLTAIAGQTVEIKFNAEAANSVWSYVYYDDISIFPATSGINENENIVASSVEQNFPNPFSETTSIKYYLDSPGQTSLKIFNQYGEEILNVFDEYKPSGEYNCNLWGLNLSAGVYYYQLTTGDVSAIKKMIVVK